MFEDPLRATSDRNVVLSPCPQRVSRTYLLGMTSVVALPFHQDDLLGIDDLGLPSDASFRLVQPPLPAGDRWQRLLALFDRSAEAVAADVPTAGLTTVVTGDCLALLGTLAGAQRAGLTPSLVWFDAHGDVHTLAGSASGYLGGMALRMAVGGDADRLSGPLGLTPVAEDRVVLVGARDLDPAEVAYLADAPIRQREVDAITARDLPDGPVVLHLDLDVIDPSDVPGLRFPVPGGPPASAVVAAVRRLVESGRVSVLDIACPWFEAADADARRVRRDLVAELLDVG